jgi:hypothetical protein
MREQEAMPDGSRRDAEAIAKAHAIYTPVILSFYDVLVHGLSNRLAWKCPTRILVDLYRDNLCSNHLEAGIGTGFFIDRSGRPRLDRLVLLDINRHCLELAARRLARYKPELVQASLLDPLPRMGQVFDSVGLTYVLHCLPGAMTEKLTVLDHLLPAMADRAVLFGATILGCGVAPNFAARRLLTLYNEKGVFNNLADDQAALETGLRKRFDEVHVYRRGLVALFRAQNYRVPDEA